MLEFGCSKVIICNMSMNAFFPGGLMQTVVKLIGKVIIVF